VLSLAADRQAFAPWLAQVDLANPSEAGQAGPQPVLFLSGPEGGLTANEDALARAHGFAPVSLGARTLRAETAPLAVLAALALAE